MTEATPEIINQAITTVDPKTLKTHPKNPRKGNLKVVKESIETNGFFGAVVVQKSTNYVLAGNHRLKAAIELGMTEIPAIFVDVNPEQALRILIADNRSSDLATYDNRELATLLESLQATDTGLAGLGFDDADLSDLLNELEGNAEDELPERPTGDPSEILERHGFNGTFGKWQIKQGDAQQVVPQLDGLFDAVVCDPPYGISFMGKGWDHAVPSPELWKSVFDKLKPGAHVFAFGGTREYHHLCQALEEAGFEIRDMIAWTFGTGFPKAFDASKGIDAELGEQRTKIKIDAKQVRNQKTAGGGKDGTSGATRPFIEKAKELGYHETDSKEAVSPEAQAFQGFATALKPAFEPCVVARKPLEGTLAKNALAYNTGALWIDGGRIGTEEAGWGGNGNSEEARPVIGKWPANIALDSAAAEVIDRQAEDAVSRFFHRADHEPEAIFYEGKASASEREAGLDHLAADRAVFGKNANDQGTFSSGLSGSVTPRANIHPTVKPIALTKWLATLALTPRREGFKRRVLVPFSGVGSEMIGCLLAGWDEVIGVEITPEYVEIATERIKAFEAATKAKA